jgi:2',3'-cyclic-nucleotide 2'-phosphodiesterase (5'-nucleotidase family)
LRDRYPNLLLVDAGNALVSDQPLTSATQGATMIEGMNRLGYDAMTLGDQDFRWGASVLKKRMSEARFPFLSANVYTGGAQSLFAQPYAIKEIAGHRIAVIGLTSKNLVSFLPQGGPEPILVSDPIETVRRVMTDLQGKADIFVLLSNLGLQQDQEVAAQVAGIALIVGGNPGTLLPEPYCDPAHGTLVVQAGYQGEWIGKLTLQIDATGKVTSHMGETIALGQEYADDASIRAWLDSLAAQH